MSRKTLGVVGLCTALACAAWFLMFKPQPMTASQEYAQAAFTRPTTPSTASQDFQIRIAGVDGLTAVPTVESCTKTEVEVILPQKPGQLIEILFVVPRLPSQGEEGFHWMDTQGCDLLLALNRDGRPVEFHKNTTRRKETFRLQPGEYVVRYYRQSNQADPEKGPPVTELLGEGRLVVIPPKSGVADCGLIPLSSDKHKIPLLLADEEPQP